MSILSTYKRFPNLQGVLDAMPKEARSPLFMHAITVVLLVASLLHCALPHVSYADEHGTSSSANICLDETEAEGITAYELSWSAKLALGNKMLFSPGSFQDAMTSSFRNATVVNAYRPDVLRETVSPSDRDLSEWQENYWYAIVDLEGDETPWYESPSYAAYPLTFSDIQSFISDGDSQECNIDFLGYPANLDATLGEALEVNASEFILLPGLAE